MAVSRIGVLNEKSLHASLKEWYTEPGDECEVPVDRFVIDIVRGDLLVEIQTGNFASIKSKVNALTQSHPLRLVYPIAREKWIVRQPKENEGEPARRKSPKHGRLEDLFSEMVSFPQLLVCQNFSLEVLVIREEESRRYEGPKRWRRNGWVIEERRLLEVLERRLYAEPRDWRGFLPPELGTFTASELAEALGLGRRLAQKMVYCLRKVSVLRLAGKRGRAHVYEIAGG